MTARFDSAVVDDVDSSPAAERLAHLEEWHFWFVGRDQLVANLLRRSSPGGRIVDVGCGTGAFAGRLARAGHQVVAVDRALHVPPAPSVAGICGDAERLALRSGSAAVVLARDVIEHVNDEAALRECHRILQPGGLLVVLVPAWPRLWSHRDERAGHRRRYTRSSLRNALTQAGFDTVELRGYQFALLPLAAVSRLAGRRRGSAQLQAEEHPPMLLNRILAVVNLAEASLARVAWLRPPTGSTLVAVARRS